MGSDFTSPHLASTATATLAGAALYASGAFAHWAGIGVVGLLMVAVEEDVRRRRIPNRLTFFALVAALLHATWTAGPTGLLSALAGAAIGLAVLGLPFAVRCLGAGDVKAVMALGAFFGPTVLLGQLWWMTLIGGVLALATLVARGDLTEVLSRWGASIALTASGRRPHYLRPPAHSAAATGLPFGFVIALGVAAQQMWGIRWIS